MPIQESLGHIERVVTPFWDNGALHDRLPADSTRRTSARDSTFDA